MKKACLTTENTICGLTEAWSQNLPVGTERTHTTTENEGQNIQCPS
jgi:hypothetical protein